MTTDRRKKIAAHATQVFESYVREQGRAWDRAAEAKSDLLLVFTTLQEFADEFQKLHQERNAAGRLVPHVFWAHNCVVVEVACQQLIFGEMDGMVYSTMSADSFNRSITPKEDEDVGMLALRRLLLDFSHVFQPVR